MITSSTKQIKPRITIPYQSKSLKSGFFSEEELTLYNLPPDSITTIIQYQKQLPILQQDENSLVDARTLHKQLNIGRQFTDWIQNRIESYGLIKDTDYFTVSRKCEIVNTKGFATITDYNLTIDCAKQLAMIERSDIGLLTRRYFIIIEKAFKSRLQWNKNRRGTLINCKELKSAIIARTVELYNGLPDWMNKPISIYTTEFNLINAVVLGMSASQYAKENDISPKSIRNNFTEDQLDDIDRLELYEAQLIMNQEIYNYE